MEKSRQQGFPVAVGPSENPIDYIVSMGKFRPITKRVESGVNQKRDEFHWENSNFEVQIVLFQEI